MTVQSASQVNSGEGEGQKSLVSSVTVCKECPKVLGVTSLQNSETSYSGKAAVGRGCPSWRVSGMVLHCNSPILEEQKKSEASGKEAMTD